MSEKISQQDVLIEDLISRMSIEMSDDKLKNDESKCLKRQFMMSSKSGNINSINFFFPKESVIVIILLHHFLGLIQNATIEERVTLLEIQVAEVDERVGLLGGDVNFLFDETVIQDERIFILEQTSNDVDDELDLINGELESKFLPLIT